MITIAGVGAGGQIGAEFSSDITLRRNSYNRENGVSRVSLMNMVIGFWLIFLSSSGGIFLAQYHLEAHLDGEVMETLSWWMSLQRSAHGHTNLFGMLHILFGLTFPYSSLRSSTKILQSVCLGSGSLAMSALLLARSWQIPRGLYDPLGAVIGTCLSLSLVALVLQITGLTMKWYRVQRSL